MIENASSGKAARAAIVAAGLIAATALHAQGDRALRVADLQSWLEAYESAWENRDAAAAGELFSADARYYETPFADPFVGRNEIRSYWAGVTADQRDIDFEAAVVGVVGNTGIARWTAEFTTASSGDEVELSGVFLLEFDENGHCGVLREWWHAR